MAFRGCLQLEPLSGCVGMLHVSAEAYNSLVRLQHLALRVDAKLAESGICSELHGGNRVSVELYMRAPQDLQLSSNLQRAPCASNPID